LAEELERLPKEPLAASVARDLRRQIMNGEIAPDERIKQEIVAERYGVSRSPVREAFRELASDGFIELERDVGARVRPFSRHEMYELYLAREALEPVIIEETCRKITEEELAAAREVNHRSETCAENGDVAGYLHLDTEMHRILLEASGLNVLTEMAAGLWRRTHRYRFAYTSPERLETSVLEHRLLLDAVGSRDTLDASDIYRIHTRRTRWTLAGMELPDS
jgi:DNA-binding GntR family transcriptional regulator